VPPYLEIARAAARELDGGLLRKRLPPSGATRAKRQDGGQLISTQNQCGQCLAWRLSVLVHLGQRQQIYLCPDCVSRQRQDGRRPA
jgi:hypothetical protein